MFFSLSLSSLKITVPYSLPVLSRDVEILLFPFFLGQDRACFLTFFFLAERVFFFLNLTFFFVDKGVELKLRAKFPPPPERLLPS